MKLLMRDEARGREHTIFVTIFSALMVMLAIVVMLMASATAISGVTLQLDENAVDILDKQVENRAGYIQDQLQQAQELTDLSTYINETAQQMLDDETLSLKTLDSCSSDSLPLLQAVAPRMLETLRSKRISGIFLILNTHDFTGRTSGDRLPCVYLRDLDPDAAPSVVNSDILLECAPSELVQTFDIATDKAWSPALQYLDGEQDVFYVRPFQAAYEDDEHIGAANYGRWTTLPYKLLGARDEQAELDRRVLRELADLIEGKLRRQPHALRPEARHLVERELVRHGKMRTDFEGNPHVDGHLHRGEAFREDGLARFRVAPRIELERRLARRADLVVIDDGHGEQALLGVAGLFHRRRQLPRDGRLAAPVVERGNVDHVSARALRGARANGVGRPRPDAAARRAGGRLVFAVLDARKAPAMIGREKPFGEILERLGANVVQLGEADAHALVQIELEVGEHVGGRAHAVDVSAHVVGAHGFRTRGLDGGAARLAHRVLLDGRGRARKAERHGKRLADLQPRGPDDRDARLEGIVGEGVFGAAHAKHAVACADAAHLGIDRDAGPTLLVERKVGDRLRGMPLPRPELEHVAWVDFPLGGNRRYAVLHVGDAADERASVVRALIAHDVVAAIAFQVRGGEPARERLFERAALFRGRFRRGDFARDRVHAVEHAAINRCHCGDVVGRFHAALDLKRRDPRSREVGQKVGRAEVLRGKKVLAGGIERVALGRVVQLVGKAAGLGAQAPVRRAPADHRRHEALPRVADAERPVPERLDLDALLRGDACQMRDFFEGKLARERDAGGAHARGSADAGCVARVHLSGDMKPDLRQRSRDLGRDTDVLDDERIGPGAPCLTSAFEGAGNLVGKDDRVKRHVDLDAAQVGEIACRGKRLRREVVGAAARVERLEAEVHRVGSGAHRRMKGAHVAGRRQKFHFPHGICLSPRLKDLMIRFMVV